MIPYSHVCLLVCYVCHHFISDRIGSAIFVREISKLMHADIQIFQNFLPALSPDICLIPSYLVAYFAGSCRSELMSRSGITELSPVWFSVVVGHREISFGDGTIEAPIRLPSKTLAMY